nr:ribonuclease H-like domain-containing protein [Tanacetum cinerariifolium]
MPTTLFDVADLYVVTNHGVWRWWSAGDVGELRFRSWDLWVMGPPRFRCACNDSNSSVSAPASESSDTIVIDCARQEDFPNVCTSSIETNVKSSKPLHAEGKGILGRRPTGKPVNPNRPKPVSAGQPNPVSAGQPNLVSAGRSKPVTAGQPNPISAGQPNPVSAGRSKPVTAGQPNPISAGQPNPISAGPPNPVYAGQPNPVSAGDGLLGPRPLNNQPPSTYFHSFTHNNQQIIFLITHNSLYSLYMTSGLKGKTTIKPSAGWPWTKYRMSKSKGSKINGGSKSKSWSFAKGPLGIPKSEMTWEKDRGIVDSGCSRSMSGNKDKLEDFEHFDGGEVTFGGSTVSQICDQTHRVLFTENECLVLSKDFPLPDPSMVILSIPRKHNLYTFSLNELAPQGP